MTFETTFGRPAEAVGEAPGRVNLLGEHTDYNDGFVLPVALSQRTRAEVARTASGAFDFCSVDIPARLRLADGRNAESDFGRYVQGCVAVLQSRGITVPGFALRVESTVPIGAGLSSSAALLVAVLRALRQLLGFEMDDVELALCAQRAEVEYVGVRVGVLDHMACSLASADQMLFLDTRSFERRLLPLPAGTRIAVIDSGTRRALTHTAYNQRRSECQQAAALLGVASLREISDAVLASALPSPLDRRVRHVVSENARVLEAIGASAQRFGELMNASHASLRDDYEVSTPALDALATSLQHQPGVLGARLTGAGFGGACVALIAQDAPQAAAEALARFNRAGFAGRLLSH